MDLHTINEAHQQAENILENAREHGRPLSSLELVLYERFSNTGAAGCSRGPNLAQFRTTPRAGTNASTPVEPDGLQKLELSQHENYS